MEYDFDNLKREFDKLSDQQQQNVLDTLQRWIDAIPAARTAWKVEQARRLGVSVFDVDADIARN